MKAGSSKKYEQVEKILPGEALKQSQADRINSVRANDYAPGKYLFLPMSHFGVPVKYNGNDYVSKRVVTFKLSEDKKSVEYPRTWKIGYFTEMLAASMADADKIVGLVPETNADGLLRVPSGKLTYIPSCNDVVPKSANDKNMFHIDRPFIIDYQGTLRGFMAQYEETATGSGKYNVKTNEDGTCYFEQARITQFSVLPDTVDGALISAAKKALAADEQLKEVVLD